MRRMGSAKAVIYFIQGVDGGPIKIGISSRPRTRLQDIQICSPVLLRLLTTIPGDVAKELSLHIRFAPWRLHGEWFQPVPELIGYIAAHGGQAIAPETEYPLRPAQPYITQDDFTQQVGAELRARHINQVLLTLEDAADVLGIEMPVFLTLLQDRVFPIFPLNKRHSRVVTNDFIDALNNGTIYAALRKRGVFEGVPAPQEAHS